MSSSLKDQLLAAGLLSKSAARTGKKKRPRKAKRREPDPEARERQALAAAHEAQRREQAREQNRQREQARQAQEQADRIRQILSSRALPKAAPGDETTRFHFRLQNRIHGLHVNAAQRQMLAGGKAGIVLFDGRYHLLALEQAQRVHELSPRRVWLPAPDEGDGDPDDPYAAYKVPDDLIW